MSHDHHHQYQWSQDGGRGRVRVGSVRQARCQRLSHPAQSLEPLVQVSRTTGGVDTGDKTRVLLPLPLWNIVFCASSTDGKALAGHRSCLQFGDTAEEPILLRTVVRWYSGGENAAGLVAREAPRWFCGWKEELSNGQRCDSRISQREGDDIRAGCQVGSALPDRWLVYHPHRRI